MIDAAISLESFNLRLMEAICQRASVNPGRPWLVQLMTQIQILQLIGS